MNNPDYETWSDFEINKAVAECLGLENNSIDHPHKSISGSKSVLQIVKGRTCDCIGYYYVDYCNNPSDAWPIMQENHIFVIPDNDGMNIAYALDCWPLWSNKQDREECFSYKYLAKDANPLRACMIVYLKMRGEK